MPQNDLNYIGRNLADKWELFEKSYNRKVAFSMAISTLGPLPNPSSLSKVLKLAEEYRNLTNFSKEEKFLGERFYNVKQAALAETKEDTKADAQASKQTTPKLSDTKVTGAPKETPAKPAGGNAALNPGGSANAAAGGGQGKTGTFKDSLGRSYCLEDGVKVDCGKTPTEGGEDPSKAAETPTPEGTPKPAKEDKQEPDYTDPTFSKEWDEEVGKQIDQIESNDSYSHPYTAQQAGAEQDWHSQFMDWRYGNPDNFQLKPEEAGIASRFISGLLNPVVGTKDHLEELLNKIVRPNEGKVKKPADEELGKELQAYFDVSNPGHENQNALAAEVVNNTLGSQARPIAADISKRALADQSDTTSPNWKNKQTISSGSGKHGVWNLPKDQSKDNDHKDWLKGVQRKAKDAGFKLSKEFLDEVENSSNLDSDAHDKYKDHWLDEFKSKAKSAGVGLSNDVLGPAVEAIDNGTSRTHDDLASHRALINNLEGILDKHVGIKEEQEAADAAAKEAKKQKDKEDKEKAKAKEKEVTDDIKDDWDELKDDLNKNDAEKEKIGEIQDAYVDARKDGKTPEEAKADIEALRKKIRKDAHVGAFEKAQLGNPQLKDSGISAERRLDIERRRAKLQGKHRAVESNKEKETPQERQDRIDKGVAKAKAKFVKHEKESVAAMDRFYKENPKEKPVDWEEQKARRLAGLESGDTFKDRGKKETEVDMSPGGSVLPKKEVPVKEPTPGTAPESETKKDTEQNQDTKKEAKKPDLKSAKTPRDSSVDWDRIAEAASSKTGDQELVSKIRSGDEIAALRYLRSSGAKEDSPLVKQVKAALTKRAAHKPKTSPAKPNSSTKLKPTKIGKKPEPKPSTAKGTGKLSNDELLHQHNKETKSVLMGEGGSEDDKLNGDAKHHLDTYLKNHANELGDRDAHGIAADNKNGLDQLSNILDNGVDPNRPFHTINLHSRGKAQVADRVGGPSSFVLLGPKGGDIKNGGVDTVVVNGNWSHAIPELKARYPNVNFLDARDGKSFKIPNYKSLPSKEKHIADRSVILEFMKKQDYQGLQDYIKAEMNVVIPVESLKQKAELVPFAGLLNEDSRRAADDICWQASILRRKQREPWRVLNEFSPDLDTFYDSDFLDLKSIRDIPKNEVVSMIIRGLMSKKKEKHFSRYIVADLIRDFRNIINKLRTYGVMVPFLTDRQIAEVIDNVAGNVQDRAIGGKKSFQIGQTVHPKESLYGWSGGVTRAGGTISSYFAEQGDSLEVVEVMTNGMLKVKNKKGEVSAQPPGKFREFSKALSWLDPNNGGALVKPPKQGSLKESKLFRGIKSVQVLHNPKDAVIPQSPSFNSNLKYAVELFKRTFSYKGEINDTRNTIRITFDPLLDREPEPSQIPGKKLVFRFFEDHNINISQVVMMVHGRILVEIVQNFEPNIGIAVRPLKPKSFVKSQGDSCKPGERSDESGCVPASGEQGTPHKKEEEEPKEKQAKTPESIIEESKNTIKASNYNNAEDYATTVMKQAFKLCFTDNITGNQANSTAISAYKQAKNEYAARKRGKKPLAKPSQNPPTQIPTIPSYSDKLRNFAATKKPVASIRPHHNDSYAWKPIHDAPPINPSEKHVQCKKGHWHWGAFGAAGVLLRHTSKSGVTRYLLQLRGPGVQHGGTWSTIGGALHKGEPPEVGAIREANEELQGQIPKNYKVAHISTDDHGDWAYHTVVADVPKLFYPKSTDWEHGGSKWVTAKEMESMNLHPDFAKWLQSNEDAITKKDPKAKSLLIGMRVKSIRFKYKKKAGDYFQNCPRDKTGHCLPQDQADQSGQQEEVKPQELKMSIEDLQAKAEELVFKFPEEQHEELDDSMGKLYQSTYEKARSEGKDKEDSQKIALSKIVKTLQSTLDDMEEGEEGEEGEDDDLGADEESDDDGISEEEEAEADEHQKQPLAPELSSVKLPTLGSVALTKSGKGKVPYDPSSLSDFFGKDVPQDLLGAATNALDNCQMAATLDRTGNLHVSNRIRDEAGKITMESDRSFSKDKDGKLVVHNDSFVMKNKGSGAGTEIFTNQVNALRKIGVFKIETHAAGCGPKAGCFDEDDESAGTFNGYYTWPRLGYDGTIPPDQMKTMPKELKAKMGNSKSVLDLYSLPGGKEWWKEYGTDLYDAHFDLSENSRSMATLNKYIEERKTRKNG